MSIINPYKRFSDMCFQNVLSIVQFSFKNNRFFFPFLTATFTLKAWIKYVADQVSWGRGMGTLPSSCAWLTPLTCFPKESHWPLVHCHLGRVDSTNLSGHKGPIWSSFGCALSAGEPSASLRVCGHPRSILCLPDYVPLSCLSFYPTGILPRADCLTRAHTLQSPGSGGCWDRAWTHWLASANVCTELLMAGWSWR